MKKKLRLLLLITIVAILLMLGLWALLRATYVVPILMYHKFGVESSSITVEPNIFKNQMAYLDEHNYTVIPLSELVEGVRAHKRFPFKTVVITIDDGELENYTVAFPVFKKYGFPATCFIITDEVGRPIRMHWDQIEQMVHAGIEIGSHCVSGAYLPDLTPKERRYEIEESKKILEKRLNVPITTFCFTRGGFTPELSQVLEDAGYRGACTTNRGFERFNRDVFKLKRIKVTNSDTVKPFHFFAKLSGYYNLFRRSKRGW